MTLWFIFAGPAIALGTLLPLSIKWELDKKLVLPSICCIGFAGGTGAYFIVRYWDLAILHFILISIFLIWITALSLLVWRFYRDPERIPPEIINVILSPADGVIKYVKHFKEGEIPLSEKNDRTFSLKDFTQTELLASGGYIVGIVLSYLDVHVNRAPINGKIQLMKHIKGLFLSLKKSESVFQNERAFMIIDNGVKKLGVVLIASRLVRKIVFYVREGENIGSGERIGMIRFGSQVDLIIPEDPHLRIEVQEKARVKAGYTVIARYSAD